jgi:hypothetical protein
MFGTILFFHLLLSLFPKVYGSSEKTHETADSAYEQARKHKPRGSVKLAVQPPTEEETSDNGSS